MGTPDPQDKLIHASAVVLDGRAIMLTGASGRGKSSLALRLIDAHGATLLGDDRLILSADKAGLALRPHENLAGLLEMRSLGLVKLPYIPTAPLGLVVALLDTPPPRLAAADYFQWGGHRIAQISLHGHDPMTALTIKYAAQALSRGFRDDAIYPLD